MKSIAKKELEEFREIVSRFSRARIGVIGDIAADVYVYGRPYKLSREAPVLVVKHEEEKTVPGSAGNAVNNLLGLDARVYPIGIVGNDDAGRALNDYFTVLGADLSGLLADPQGKTITKTRIMAGDDHTSKQQVIRIDKDPDNILSRSHEDLILSHLKKIGEKIDGLLVSDYGYQLITPRIVQYIKKLAKKILVVVDSHERLLEFEGVTAITPNEAEAQFTSGIRIEKEGDYVRAGEKLLRITDCQALFLTRGNKGMALFEKDKPVMTIPIFGSEEIVDVTGAGDTVASVLILSLACGASFQQAAKLSDYAAAVVVMKRGTATLSRKELLEVVEGNRDRI